MDAFDDEVMAVVRDLAATLGVPEHLRPAAAGRARRADIFDRGFVPRVLVAFDAAQDAAHPLRRRYVSSLMLLADGGAVECRRLVATPGFLAFLRTALGVTPTAPADPTADAAFDLEILVLLSTTINFLDAPALEALGPAIGQALSAALTALPLHPTRRAPDVLQHALELSDGVFTLIEAVGLRGGPAAVAVFAPRVHNISACLRDNIPSHVQATDRASLFLAIDSYVCLAVLRALLPDDADVRRAFAAANAWVERGAAARRLPLDKLLYGLSLSRNNEELHYRRHMTMTGGLYPGESPAKYVGLCLHADPTIARAGFVALAAFVDYPMPSNVYDPAACVATRCPAAKEIERAVDEMTISSAKELNGMVAVAETTLRYFYDPACHLLAQKAANNVSSLVLRCIAWLPAMHSLFPRGPRAIVKTVLPATARGAIAVPFDVVVSKILPFAITLRRGMLAAHVASDDDEDEDEDGSIAGPHGGPLRGSGRRLGRRPRRRR